MKPDSVKVDWLSYTYQAFEPLETPQARAALSSLVNDTLPEYLLFSALPQANPVGRQGFSYCLNLSNMIYIFGSYQGVVLVEHTGKGCDWLRDEGILENVILHNQYNLTRLDIAGDFATTTKPDDVKCGNARIKSSGTQRSATGTTYYHGSQKSERFARVYRYNPPHPRAHLLRIELVTKHEQARIAARVLLQGGAAWAFDSGATVYQFSGIDTGDAQPMKAAPDDRRSGSTVFWLYTQVAPALARMLDDDAIVLEDFLGHVRKHRTEQRTRTDGLVRTGRTSREPGQAAGSAFVVHRTRNGRTDGDG